MSYSEQESWDRWQEKQTAKHGERPGYTMYKVHTWTCSVPNCDKQLTAANNHLYAVEQGWGQYIIESFGMADDRPNHLSNTPLYLCPFHNKELMDFLFKEKN